MSLSDALATTARSWSRSRSGAVVRVAVMVAFPPGFVFSDGPTYLALVDDMQPLADRAVGYGFLLDALAAVSPGRLAGHRSSSTCSAC